MHVVVEPNKGGSAERATHSSLLRMNILHISIALYPLVVEAADVDMKMRFPSKRTKSAVMPAYIMLSIAAITTVP